MAPRSDLMFGASNPGDAGSRTANPGDAGPRSADPGGASPVTSGPTNAGPGNADRGKGGSETTALGTDSPGNAAPSRRGHRHAPRGSGGPSDVGPSSAGLDTGASTSADSEGNKIVEALYHAARRDVDKVLKKSGEKGPKLLAKQQEIAREARQWAQQGKAIKKKYKDLNADYELLGKETREEVHNIVGVAASNIHQVVAAGLGEVGDSAEVLEQLTAKLPNWIQAEEPHPIFINAYDQLNDDVFRAVLEWDKSAGSIPAGPPAPIRAESEPVEARDAIPRRDAPVGESSAKKRKTSHSQWTTVNQLREAEKGATHSEEEDSNNSSGDENESEEEDDYGNEQPEAPPAKKTTRRRSGKRPSTSREPDWTRRPLVTMDDVPGDYIVTKWRKYFVVRCGNAACGDEGLFDTHPLAVKGGARFLTHMRDHANHKVEMTDDEAYKNYTTQVDGLDVMIHTVGQHNKRLRKARRKRLEGGDE